MTTDLGYEAVTIYEDRSDPSNPGWAYRARFSDGRGDESGEVDCDVDATPSEAVSAWCEEHLGYSGKAPLRTRSTTDGARVLEWS
jgi:hypothetical protein